MYKWQVDITYFAPAAEDVILYALQEHGFVGEETIVFDAETTYRSWIMTHASAHAMTVFSLKWSNIMDDIRVIEL
jgi:hypothetical protein